jgi:hypothetical protein
MGRLQAKTVDWNCSLEGNLIEGEVSLIGGKWSLIDVENSLFGVFKV